MFMNEMNTVLYSQVSVSILFTFNVEIAASITDLTNFDLVFASSIPLESKF